MKTANTYVYTRRRINTQWPGLLSCVCNGGECHSICIPGIPLLGYMFRLQQRKSIV